ncbi:MAG: hypothetical protein WC700_18570 [Gemmatimonadaceae bacterium]|jgi:hypothetical protein
MKAITVRQPWVWAMQFAGKDVENRSWKCPPAMFGTRVAIHASKYWSRAVMRNDVKFVGTLARRIISLPSIYVTLQCSLGCVCGTAEIVPLDETSPWWMGEYGFGLRNMMWLPKPIPCRGALRFWRVPDDVLSQIVAQDFEVTR